MSNEESAMVSPSWVRIAPARAGREPVTIFMPRWGHHGSRRRRCAGMLFLVPLPGVGPPGAGRHHRQRAVEAGYPSGQRELTVNQLALPTWVRIPHLPPPRISVIRGTGTSQELPAG